MTNSLKNRNRDERFEAPLAPVIPIRSVPVESKGQSGKVSKIRVKEKMPDFYTKPIFKTKKYDLF